MPENTPETYPSSEIVELSKEYPLFAVGLYLALVGIVITLGEFVSIYLPGLWYLSWVITLLAYCVQLALSFIVLEHAGRAIPNKLVSTFFTIVLTVFSFAAIGIPTLLRSYCGPCKPGAFFERTEYAGVFYINVFPEASKSKNYRLPGYIKAYDNPQEDTTLRIYKLKYFVLPNGETATFDNDEETSLDPKQGVSIEDDKGKSWYIEMTDVEVKP